MKTTYARRGARGGRASTLIQLGPLVLGLLLNRRSRTFLTI
jgi:hypothetical protein